MRPRLCRLKTHSRHATRTSLAEFGSAGVLNPLGACALRSDYLILERSLDTAGRSLYHNCVLSAVRSKGSLTCIFA